MKFFSSRPSLEFTMSQSMSGISINSGIDDITPDDSVSRGSEDIVTKKRNRPSGKTISNTIQYKRWPKCGEHVTIIEEPSNIPEECYENDSNVESEFEENSRNGL